MPALRALLDVNLLIALHDAQHVHHALVKAWFVSHAAKGWASCPLTQNGCLRILSQPNYPNPVPMAHLVGMLQRSFSAAQHRFWPDDISMLDAARFDHALIQGHRQLTDIYLLALAVKHRGCFVTLDKRALNIAVRSAGADRLVALMPT